ncbi:tau-tubulin kinase [Anaeramoeba flamelloides]|uniref:Tau-tubulin kinase n=1 Tax=Anaeramoeba flamelloides TaxID=1746091 RepID=A0AAV7Y8A4_9EUKA|nr:tau-tubulin kinase [Anaeramoeba flamelloides]
MTTPLKGRWKLLKKIGQGGFGEIYAVYDLETQKKVAAKMEKIDKKKRSMKLEIAVLRKIQKSRFSAKFICCGRNQVYNYFVMELLGPDLSALRKKQPQKRFSLATTLKLGIQSNFALRIQNETNEIKKGSKADCCIIDFGLARKYIDSEGQILPPREKAGFRGTARYASLNSHNRKELSRRDDLWSLFYVFIEFLEGSLPWTTLKEKEEITEAKKMYTNVDLCRNLPKEFTSFFRHINSLKYQDKPNYKYLRRLLKDLYMQRGFGENINYDWEETEYQSTSMKQQSSRKTYDSAIAFTGITNDRSINSTQKKRISTELQKQEIRKMSNIFFHDQQKDECNNQNNEESDFSYRKVYRKRENEEEKSKNSKSEVNEFEKMMKMINAEENTETSCTVIIDKKTICCTIL